MAETPAKPPGWIARMLGKPPPPPSARPPAIPPGQRVYAIGDIHGRDDLFAELIARIDADTAGRRAADVTLILLGDLIDRGPASAQAIDRAVTLVAERGAIAIKGNHEEILLRALDGEDDALDLLLRVGGDATLRSYGIPAADVATLDSGSLVWQLASAVPQAHVALLEAMVDRVAIGDYLFVHAGIRPGVALEQQRPADLRWIRDAFLDHPGDHGAMIVHGHSISAEPQLLANRIGIDTGAYATDRLTALGLEGTERWLLQT